MLPLICFHSNSGGFGGGGGAEYVDRKSGTPPQRGAVGLRNLGNTCYMNAVLQCMSHTEPLRQYFSSTNPLLKKEMNVDNPMGCGGKLADAFVALLGDIWRGPQQFPFEWVAPRHLRNTISTRAPRFGTYRQHDAAELMTELLHWLHEEVRRCRP